MMVGQNVGGGLFILTAAAAGLTRSITVCGADHFGACHPALRKWIRLHRLFGVAPQKLGFLGAVAFFACNLAQRRFFGVVPTTAA